MRTAMTSASDPPSVGLPRVTLSAYGAADLEAWEMADLASRRNRS